MDLNERQIFKHLTERGRGHCYVSIDLCTVYILDNPENPTGLYELKRSEPFDPNSETLDDDISNFIQSFFKK